MAAVEISGDLGVVFTNGVIVGEEVGMIVSGDVGVVLNNAVITGDETGMFVRESNVRAEGCAIVSDQPVDFDGEGDLELVNCRDHFGNSSGFEACAAPISNLIHRIVRRHLG